MRINKTWIVEYRILAVTDKQYSQSVYREASLTIRIINSYFRSGRTPFCVTTLERRYSASFASAGLSDVWVAVIRMMRIVIFDRPHEKMDSDLFIWQNKKVIF